MRELILNTVSDLARDFVYYDRKEDEELMRGDIENAIKNKVITVDEIVEQFKKELTEWGKL